MDEAMTLLDVEQEERRARACDEWLRCHELARESNILQEFGDEVRARGFVGSLVPPKLAFLVLTSRLLPRPVSLVLRGLSSAGKSYAIESTLAFFPKSAYFSRSGLSDRALVFSAESFKHRILYIAEADGLGGDTSMSAFFLRTLLSENRIVYEVVEKESDRLITRVIEKPGPTGAILTTTRLHLEPQIETRMLALTVPDDPALTGQIMRSIAQRDDEADDDEPPEAWKAFQSWLELGGERRVVDEDGFLIHVSELTPPVAVRLRRDFALVRALVQTHALLHQMSRDRDEHGRILATLEDDYGAVRSLIAEIVAEGVGATIPDDLRKTVAAVATALEQQASETPGDESGGVRRAHVQAELRLDERATRRRLASAVERGFIINTNPGRGRTASFRLGDPIPDDFDVLPPVEAVRDSMTANPATRTTRQLIPGIETLPPPSRS
jgi:hypothetical protein